MFWSPSNSCLLRGSERDPLAAPRLRVALTSLLCAPSGSMSSSWDLLRAVSNSTFRSMAPSKCPPWTPARVNSCQRGGTSHRQAGALPLTPGAPSERLWHPACPALPHRECPHLDPGAHGGQELVPN